jgi:hypothetical protein
VHKIELLHALPGDGGRRSRREVLSAAVPSSTGGVSAFGSPASAGASATGGLLGAILSGPANEAAAKTTELTTVLGQLRAVQETSIGSLTDNTRAVDQNTVTKSGGGGVLGAIGKAAGSFLTGGFGLGPLISGLFGLFGGSSSQPVTQFTRFQLPPSANFQGGISGANPGQITATDAGQNGQPRSVSQSAPAMVTIQVNAMDSRSFLDHRDEIASAVREAILHSSSLNDAISDL